MATRKLTFSQLATLRDILKYEKLDSDKNNPKKLKEIKVALSRIEEGDYGDCSECSEHITYKHLLKTPTETKCFSCSGKKL